MMVTSILWDLVLWSSECRQEGTEPLKIWSINLEGSQVAPITEQLFSGISSNEDFLYGFVWMI